MALCACGSKSEDDKAPTPAAGAKTGAATPEQVFVTLRTAVKEKDFGRALALLRPEERTLFVGLTFLDLAMPALLKIVPQKQIDAYAEVARKHNLDVDEAELKAVARSRDFGALKPYFERIFAGNDLVALWADVAAALPKERNRWPNIKVGNVTVDGDKAKVALTLEGRDGAGVYYAVRVAGRWYIDMEAFATSRRTPPMK